MTTRNTHSECLKYTPYFYDYVFGEQNTIPESAVKHISNCTDCQIEIDNLKRELQSCENSTDQAIEAARLCNMELHFAYVGKNVGCCQAKAFIAPMSLDNFNVNIPTPITVHFNHCKACSADLKFVRDFALPEKTLFKIGQVIAPFSSGDPHGPGEIIDALNGIDIKESQREILAAIAGRPESGIKTLFTFKDETVEQSERISEDPYKDWQIDVKILQHNHESAGSADDAQKQSRQANSQFLSSSLLRFAKPLVAAAAVIAVVFLMFNGSQASAGLDKVYGALGQIKNVCIKSINAADGSVAQEVWISRDINVKIFKTKNKSILWDIENKRLISRKSISGVVEESDLDADSLLLVDKSMQVPWSLLPFKTQPAGSVWKKVSDDSIDNTLSDVEVYELTWTEHGMTGKATSKMWRGYLEIDTYLPKRVEWLDKLENEEDYQLRTIVEVTYPETEQIRAVIDAIAN
ncbi:MAG: hypothetical protein FVQ82_15865 [Planctomycetes bacterium]|nr:hypothetical protein [Planctomycetota bacterium]